MRRYYRLHAAVYDATRWTFLFGRKRLIDQLPFEKEERFTLLEVGCGTGHNLRRVAGRFPNARIIGVDVSPDMLRQATQQTVSFSKRVFLFERPYSTGSFRLSLRPDIVICSYSLTMFNPGWEEARPPLRLVDGAADVELPVCGTSYAVDDAHAASRLYQL